MLGVWGCRFFWALGFWGVRGFRVSHLGEKRWRRPQSMLQEWVLELQNLLFPAPQPTQLRSSSLRSVRLEECNLDDVDLSHADRV